MIIDKTVTGTTLAAKLEGRIDTLTSPVLEKELFADENIVDMRLDFEKIVYLSSAGLRVLLKAHKTQKAKHGKVILTNVCETVMEVLEMTGFADLLVLE
jgi:anti-sigma B factor antagonist